MIAQEEIKLNNNNNVNISNTINNDGITKLNINNIIVNTVMPNQTENKNISSVSTNTGARFRIPKKEIHITGDMARFKQSTAYLLLTDFIVRVNTSIKGKKNTDPHLTSPAIDTIIVVLNKLDLWITEIPPIPQCNRFGNKAFKTWLNKLQENVQSLMEEILPVDLKDAAIEIATYFYESWGNIIRLDYGTGHEASFIGWLCCLERLGILNSELHHAAVSDVFARYLVIMRRLQTVYQLEPAGSHGVWSLDDYQFMPFYWGASQLINNSESIQPKSILSRQILDAFSNDYLYIAAINFIHQMKTGPFAEHSPILNDVTNVPHWEKVNQGMLKMYLGEVFGKFPVMQHFLFGNIISYEKK